MREAVGARKNEGNLKVNWAIGWGTYTHKNHKEKSFSIILKIKADWNILCRCTESTLLHYAISSSCSYFLLSRGLWLKTRLSSKERKKCNVNSSGDYPGCSKKKQCWWASTVNNTGQEGETIRPSTNVEKATWTSIILVIAMDYSAENTSGWKGKASKFHP